MTILAHRGITTNARDNAADALSAVAKAARMGIPLGIEMDTHQTLDDFVLNHDPFEGGVPLFQVPLAELRLRLREHSPITLAEGLQLLDGVPVINIELKETNTAALAIGQVLRHCERTGQPIDSYMFVSFLPRALAEVKRIDDRFPTGLLVDEDYTVTRPSAESIVQGLNHQTPADAALEAEKLWSVVDHIDAQFLSVHWTKLNSASLQCAAARGKQLLPWSVNSPLLMNALLQRSEVGHIVTDFPEIVFPELASETAHRKFHRLAESV